MYDTITEWRENLFQTPSGKAGKDFIKLLTVWLKKFNTDSTFKGIGLKVFMTLPSLMLQKPSATSKTKDHVGALQSRLELWNKGDFAEILREGSIIQQRLASSTKKVRKTEDAARIFSKLMFEGKVRAALKFIEKNGNSGLLPSSDDVIHKLKEKHPAPAIVQSESLFSCPVGLILQTSTSLSF